MYLFILILYFFNFKLLQIIFSHCKIYNHGDIENIMLYKKLIAYTILILK